MIMIIIIKHTNPDSELRFFPLGFYIRNLGFLGTAFTLGSVSGAARLLLLSPRADNIIIMSRATDNGVQSSIMKSSRGS